jgi:hypothetical protein
LAHNAQALAVTIEPAVVVVAGLFGRSDLWMMDLTSGVFRRMTHEQNASMDIGPWSPDSQRIAVNLFDGRLQELEVASGKTTALTPHTFTAADWRPDGRSLLCFEIGRSRLSVLPLGDATKRALRNKRFTSVAGSHSSIRHETHRAGG